MNTKLPEFLFSSRIPERTLLNASFIKSNTDFIPLSFGYPDLSNFPKTLFETATSKALLTEDKSALQYFGGPGSKKILEWIKQRSLLRSIKVKTEEILITTGSGQGIDLATRILTNSGDMVWTEAPTFFGALKNFQAAEVNVRCFPLDENGLQVELVEEALKEAIRNKEPLPKMFYTIPNYHNPEGVKLSFERRKKLAELAEKYNFYILEDDAYAELGFIKKIIPAIYSLCPERVIYLSTFSKIIAPGLRVAWAIAEESVLHKMKILKSDGSTSVFLQEVIHHLVEDLNIEKHIDDNIERYRNRRDVMLEEIEKTLQGHVSYNVPDGGFFLWLTFDKRIDTSEILQIATSKYGVNFIEGKQFYPDIAETNHMRLCFSYCDEEKIRQGIQGIANAYFDYLKLRTV